MVHFGVRLLLGIFEKKTPNRTWLCAGISPLMSEMITEPECRSELRPEFAFYVRVGTGAGVNVKVCAGANQNF